MRLLKIEATKLIPYRAFWVFFALHVIFLLLITASIGKLEQFAIPGETYFFSFPEVWFHLTLVASYLHLLPGILFIMLVCNEFTFRTFRQNVIDGLGRHEAVLAKFLAAAGYAFVFTLLLFLYGFIRALMGGHFSGFGNAFEKAHYLPLFYLQMCGSLSLAIFLAFLIKKSALSIIIFLSYSLIVERLLKWQLPDHVEQYLPVHVFNQLVAPPANPLEQMMELNEKVMPPEITVLLALGYIAVFILVSLLVVQRSDL